MQHAQETLKSQFTSYWIYLVMVEACRHRLFDRLVHGPQTASQLCAALDWQEATGTALLDALVEDACLQRQGQGYALADKGWLLTEGHPQSLRQACLLWAQEQWQAWTDLAYTLRTGQSAFERRYGQGFFDYLSQHPDKAENYHRAMHEYAREDYTYLPKVYNFGVYKNLADLGGGRGALSGFLAAAYPQLPVLLVDLPKVIALGQVVQWPNLKPLAANFFEPLPFQVEALILARILHDWPDEACLLILRHCHGALGGRGHLFVIENVQDRVATPLLSLHMQVVCRSYERSRAEYDALLAQAGFAPLDQRPLGNLQTVLRYVRVD